MIDRNKKIYKYLLIICCIFFVGCRSINSRIGKDSADYSKAVENKPLIFPPNALAASTRYDIPTIPDNNKPIITNPLPPDYCKE